MNQTSKHVPLSSLAFMPLSLRPAEHGFTIIDGTMARYGTISIGNIEDLPRAIIHAANCHDDLLAALRAVVAVADRKTDEFHMARAAIAKAEGHPMPSPNGTD